MVEALALRNKPLEDSNFEASDNNSRPGLN
jgi:hypothetical protein